MSDERMRLMVAMETMQTGKPPAQNDAAREINTLVAGLVADRDRLQAAVNAVEKLALMVKLADIKHNTATYRMAMLPAETRQRLTEKYAADLADLVGTDPAWEKA